MLFIWNMKKEFNTRNNISRSNISKIFILLLLAFISVQSSHAEGEIKQEQLKSYSLIVDKIEQDLDKNVHDEKKISEAISEITPLKPKVVQCITAEDERLVKLKIALGSFGEATNEELPDVKKKRTELIDEINNVEKLVAGCKVLSLRIEEAQKQLTSLQQGLLTARLLLKEPDIKNILEANWHKSSSWVESFVSFVTNNIGIDQLSKSNVIVLVVIVIFTAGFGFLLRRYINNKVTARRTTDTFSSEFLRALCAVFGYYILHFMVSLSVAAFFYVITSAFSPVPFVSIVAYGMPFYILLLALIELFLAPRKPAELFHGMDKNIAKALARRLEVLLLLFFLGYLLFSVLATMGLPQAIYLLARGVYAIVFVLNLIWAVWLLGQLPRFADTLAWRMGASVILISILVAELLGYRNLSTYVGLALTGTLFSFGIVVFINRLINEIFDSIVVGKHKWQRFVSDSLGTKSDKTLPVVTWIKFISNSILWFIFILVILKIWGLSSTGFERLQAIISEGFTLGSLTIVPSKVLLAVITLIALFAISRYFKRRLERDWLIQTQMERGAREAMVTVSGYLGAAIAIIVSLSIAGVEFGNLAIIAGALSVGIGFGLQNIVNNFVSGLILLFERPVKTGDWIIVGNTEGFVKRISIRSTHIQTFDQADVIVPNSDLISGQVTNWMLLDVKGRIRVPVGVAYGSDTKLVHKLLTDVAAKHPSVVTDGSSPQPTVLFMAFGDSALLFELRVFIESIPKKFQVVSDLNFAIDEAFREHNIQIPFPQRDVHIKSTE